MPHIIMDVITYPYKGPRVSSSFQMIALNETVNLINEDT